MTHAFDARRTQSIVTASDCAVATDMEWNVLYSQKHYSIQRDVKNGVFRRF